MTEIRLVKKYPHIKDEDVISIFLEGYTAGFKNGRKGAITVEWIKRYVEKNRNYTPATVREVTAMLDEWRRDNGDHS